MSWRSISLLQPWAWWVVSAPPPFQKLLENRVPSSSVRHALRTYREPFLLHASAGLGKSGDFHATCERIASIVLNMPGGDRAWLDFQAQQLETRMRAGVTEFVPGPAMLRGGIIGRARVVGVITPDGDPFDLEARGAIDRLKPDMRWHLPGWWGHVLEDVAALPFTPCPGALGLWPVPPAVVAKLGLSEVA